MKTYRIPLVPGPVSIPSEVLAAYQHDYGSSDLEDHFFELYATCERGLQQMLETKNRITIQSGEGMLALWGALKSVLKPGDRVLAVGTGLFGYGIGDMAKQIGAEVKTVGFELNEVADPEKVRQEALSFQPKLVTMVHCETPSGTLNSLYEIGQICREIDALYYVDFVASGGGCPVDVDANQIDLGLLGSQKVLSLMPDLSMISVSDRAWDTCEAVQYVGYDALLPWQTVPESKYMPYTHNWHAMAGLKVSLDLFHEEGPENVYQRHADVAAACRALLLEMGVALYAASEDICAPTVTAAKVPEGWSWPELDQALRQHDIALGGNYGPLANKVFRVGHMGNQARLDLVQKSMTHLRQILHSK